MAEPSTHSNYTFEDIQRYLQGKMSAAEMHDIEKAALQDAFLADAIEGYTNVPAITAQQHLNEINAALLGKNKQFKVVSFNRKTQWLRIAAMIIILAGVGIVGSYVFKSSNKQQQVAQVKKESINKTNTAQDSVAAIAPETSSVNKNIIAQNNKRQKNIHQLKKEERTESKINADAIAEDKANDVSVMAAPSEQNNQATKSFAPAILSNQRNNDSLQNKLEEKVSGISTVVNTFSGKVVDENNKPVAGAVVETNDKKKEAMTDINGNFILRQNDSLLNVTASTIGYENKNALLKPNDTNLIKLRGITTALNDVVATGYGIKNKPKNQGATPVGGWQNFNNYVISELNKDSTGKENYISGNDVVELEFLIDNSGNPYDIKIIKSLDEQRNSKAISILETGPKWISNSKNKKAKLAIAF